MSLRHRAGPTDQTSITGHSQPASTSERLRSPSNTQTTDSLPFSRFLFETQATRTALADLAHPTHRERTKELKLNLSTLLEPVPRAIVSERFLLRKNAEIRTDSKYITISALVGEIPRFFDSQARDPELKLDSR